MPETSRVRLASGYRVVWTDNGKDIVREYLTVNEALDYVSVLLLENVECLVIPF